MNQTFFALVALAAFAALSPAAAGSRKAAPTKPVPEKAIVPKVEPRSTECRQFVPDAGVIIAVPCRESTGSASTARVPESGSSAARGREGLDCKRFDPGSRTTITVPCGSAALQTGALAEAATLMPVVAPAARNGAVSETAGSGEAGKDRRSEAVKETRPVGTVAKAGCGPLIDRVLIGEASAEETERLRAGC